MDGRLVQLQIEQTLIHSQTEMHLVVYFHMDYFQNKQSNNQEVAVNIILKYLIAIKSRLIWLNVLIFFTCKSLEPSLQKLQ